MTQITKRTPSHYRNRHSDWYNGVFGEVCHQIGLIGEALFYLDCENKAQFIENLNPLQNTFPFENIEQWIKSIFKNHYTNNYLNVYDEWALWGCKAFEQLEGKFGEVFSDIQSQVKEAKAYINNNLIKPIRDKINSEILPQVNNVLSRIRDAESQVRSIQNKVSQELEPIISQVQTQISYAESSIKSIQSKVNNELIPIVNNLDDKIRDLDAQVRNATSSLENFRTKLNESIETLNSHGIDINQLWNHVKALEAGTPTSGSSFDELVEKVKEALI